MKTISFVIPFYNEEKRLPKTMYALKNLAMPKGTRLAEVVFVNDGSTDETLKLLRRARMTVLTSFKKRFPKVTIRIITYRNNQGKGFAIQQGMLSTSSDYTLFFDADMSTPLSELSKFVPYMNKNIQVIVGTRKNGKSTVIVHQPKLREMLGRVFTKTAQIALQVDTTDFTCGFKAFSKKAKETIFSKTQVRRWGYDGEILYLTKKYQLSWKEKAVKWSNDPNTKVSLTAAIPQTLLDLALIRWYHEGNAKFEAIKHNLLSSLPLAGRIAATFI